MTEFVIVNLGFVNKLNTLQDDPDDGLSVKDIACKRFRRNHSLINDIFSEVVIPDVRNVVTTARMQVLKRQVQSLSMHQKKLETELSEIEAKYVAKKQRLVETSEEFHKELEKCGEKLPVEDKYEYAFGFRQQQL
jgi:SWI/SNF-related matrix-associated actin-dependent regulator of chromatin subfamily E protein 1